MKLICVLTIAACLQVSGGSFGQTVTVSFTNSPIEKVFREIERQTGYSFIFTRVQLKQTKPVTISATNEQLKEVLLLCFQNQPLTFVIEDKYIVVQNKTFEQTPSVITSGIDINGRVMNENGEPLAGVTITAKKSGKATSSNEQGEFLLRGINENDVLVFTSIGFQAEEINVNKRTAITVTLKIAIDQLDETIIMGYGTTSRRFNTGSITKVTSAEIERQPVSNPLAALQGRVPGLFISQTSGVLGSSFSVAIRGRTTLDPSLSRNDPLFIIDGVPFEPGNLSTNQLRSAANKPRNTTQGGLSPFNTINPMDIESIEVLKDADATAIYGSRGANGVILITTKRGKAGRTSVSINIYNGWSRVTRTMDLLNTQQYLQMRREAISNDGFIPQATNGAFSNGYAPDILVWDTAKFVDYKKLVIGNTAMTTDANLSLSGGKENTQFLISAGYHRETNVFSSDLEDKRASLNFNLTHKSSDKKFSIQLSGFYSNDQNNLLQNDLTQYINLPPNFDMYDSSGKPNWIQKGIAINNLNFLFSSVPAAELLKRYSSVNDNLLGNLQLSYRLTKHLVFRSSLGYNKFGSDEESNTPKSSLHPLLNAFASASFGNSVSKSWIIEPNLDYTRSFKTGRINILLGSTLQERKTKAENIAATDYTSDLLLSSVNAAGQIRATNNHSQYRYTAFFGRINYNLLDRYIINLSGRRDGSSRFGPANRFTNFGAIGVAWIFSNEKRLKEDFTFLSFGKIRASYGLTGNDQIGDYRYLDLWASSGTPYQAMPGLVPSSLFNPSYRWEKNRKFEAAVDLGIAKDIVLLSAAFSVNRSNNQLINYKLPNQTGFSSVIQNLPAVVQNTTWEFTITTKNATTENFNWTSFLNLTIPNNKLLSFPGLATSGYASLYQEGQALNIIRLYQYEGVDPATGIYKITDVNKDGIYNAEDFLFSKNTDPKFYGGFQNILTYKSFDFSFLFEFRKQWGRNYLAVLGNNQPGLAANQPSVVLNRWQKPGDIAGVQKFTSSFGGAVAYGAAYLNNSDGSYSDASFVRLKNLSFSWLMPKLWLNKLRMESAKIYLQSQNLFVLTNYLGSDPETQDIFVLPPLKTVALGIQVTF